MEPKIVERDAFHVVGMTQRFTPGRIDGIPALWDRFILRASEVRDGVAGAPGTSGYNSRLAGGTGHGQLHGDG